MRCQIDIEADGSYSWRLTASNGRVIAVAATVYEDYGACRAAFEQLCAEAERLPGELHHSAEGNGWVWRMRDTSGRSVAVASRAYERHSTCRTAYDRFRAVLTELGSGRTALWDDAD